MKLTLPFLAAFSLLMSWNFWGTMVSGKRGLEHLVASHKQFHKTLYGNTTNSRHHSPEVRKTSGIGKIHKIKKVGSGFSDKRSSIVLPNFRESAKDDGRNLEHISHQDASVVYDTSDLEFVDGAAGDETIEIINGRKQERGKTGTLDSSKTIGKHAREKQRRRQQIESGIDFGYQEPNQADHEQNNDEEYTDKEILPSNNIVGNEYENVGPGASKPVEYATSLPRDNPLTDEAQSDYRSARLSMAEGTNKESELFHDELDGVLGALVKSDSALGRKTGEHHQQDVKRPKIDYHESDDSGMSSDSTGSSSDDADTSIDEIVTETEGNTTAEADKSYSQGINGSVWDDVMSSEKNKSHNNFFPGVESVPGSEPHPHVVETFGPMGKEIFNKEQGKVLFDQRGENTEQKGVQVIHNDGKVETASTFIKEKPDSKTENPDDVNETDIEEIDDENRKLGDGDMISLIDQKQPNENIKNIPNDGGNNARVEDAAELFHEPKGNEVKLKQSLREPHISHENYIDFHTGLSGKGDKAANNVESMKRNPEDLPQNERSETDQRKQLTAMPDVTDQWLNEAPSNGETSDIQPAFPGIISPPHQGLPENMAKANKTGSSLAKLLIDVNQQATKMHEYEGQSSEQKGADRASKLNVTSHKDRQLKSPFTIHQLENRSRDVHSDTSPVSSRKSPGLLLHEILMDYFKNESSLREILKSRMINNATEHSVENLNLTISSMAKYLSHAAKLLAGSTNSLVTAKNSKSELQIQDKTGLQVTGFSEKGGNLAKQSMITEGENTSHPQLSATIGSNKNNTNKNINNANGNSNNNNNQSRTIIRQEVATYLDDINPEESSTPSPEPSRTYQAIKKQKVNGSEEDIILVLKNKTFGILIGQDKNSTVRLLSAPSAPNSDREQATTVKNDTLAVTHPKMDINTTTEPVSEANLHHVNQSEGQTNGLNIKVSQNDIGFLNVSNPKDQAIKSGSHATSRDNSFSDRNQDSTSYAQDGKSLEIVLSRDFMSDWEYDQKSFEELGISSAMLRSGVASLGMSKRLMRVFRKALRGTDIQLLVIGGSISAGGGLEVDRKNLKGVYYKALVNWWNMSITPITTSTLNVNAVTIGGTDSEYFSYCIKNYIDQLPDIVIWELASNDYRRYEGRNFRPGKPLEQLTRIILTLPSHPALMFVNFFNRESYKMTDGQDCPNSEDEGGQAIAQLYGIPSLSWRDVVCPEIGPEGTTLSLDNLFSSDRNHPSIMGHAQMAALLNTYMKSVLEKTISLEREDTRAPNDADSDMFGLPQPMYNNALRPRPMCWTLLIADYTSKLHNTLPEMEFTSANGFQFTNISHWPIRLDRQRCLRAVDKEATLKMKFFIPPLPTPNKENGSNTSVTREVVIMSHNSFGGSARVWLDENHGAAHVITEYTGKGRTQADVMKLRVQPGVHTLTVQDLQQGFCLSAVAVS